MSPTTRRTPSVPGGGSALRPPAREPLPPTPARPAAVAPVSPAPPVEVFPEPPASTPAPVDGELPPPPPAARRTSREQLNTKIRVDLRQRLSMFVERHDSTLQGVLEAALDEYMSRRGWSWEDYQRASRRR